MKRLLKTIIVAVMSITVTCSMIPVTGTAFADDSGNGQTTVNVTVNGTHDDPAAGELPISVDKPDASAGKEVNISADTVASVNGESYYLAQIRLRYEKTNGKISYAVLKSYRQFSGDSVTASFDMPGDAQSGTVDVIGDYISAVWDGTVDLTWYDPKDSAYEIRYAAQWAGAAALCNGIFNDIPTREYTTKDSSGNTVNAQIPDIKDAEGNKIGLLTKAECTDSDDKFNGNYLEGTVSSNDGSSYQVFSDNDGDGRDTAVVGDIGRLKIRTSTFSNSGGNNVYTTDSFWFGDEAYTGKTVDIVQDLDMGGVLKNGARKTDPGNLPDDPNWTGPNYMPVGGGYTMDVNNGFTKIGSGFNGKLNGHGHIVNNICMMRHVTNGFGNSQHTGFIGLLGSSRVELTPRDYPVVENIAVDGFIYGNRMVGGIVGETYHSKKLEIKNCINFATVYNTDAKGCAGIVGSGIHSIEYGDPQPIIRNCANFGYICTGYNKGAAGLVGYSESVVFDSYSVGYAGHDGDGEATSAQSLGTNNGGALWFNAYALKGASWPAVKNYAPVPGSQTPEVYGSTLGSAIMVKDSPADFKTDNFLGMINGKVKNGGTDKNGYMTSDDSVIKNTKRNWVKGEETNDKQFISDGVKTALENVQSWHDPAVTYDQFTGYGVSAVAKKLTPTDCTGMPVPVTFMEDAATAVSITYTGIPTLEYLEGERFDTGDHSKQSEGPGKDQPDSDSEFSVWVNFDDGSYDEITDYEITYQNSDEGFTADDSKVTVHASYGELDFTKEFDITVARNELLSMEITSPPTSLLYARDEHFSPDGMTVTTKYGAGEKAVMAVKATWKDGYPVIRLSKDPTRLDDGTVVFPGNTYTEVKGETAAAFAYEVSPDSEADLSPELNKITVSHTFSGKTLSEDVELKVLESNRPDVRKDSYNNWEIDIASEDDLLWFANNVNTKAKTDNNENPEKGDPDMGAVLIADITVTDPDFAPIGSYRGKTIPYAGKFNGNNKSITFDIDSPGRAAALFYNIGSKGSVEDLTVKGNITGGTGSANDEITPSTAYNAVSSVAVTLNGGRISGCTNKADITAVEKAHTGGIAGDCKGGTIEYCVNEGTVSAGGYYAGGITASTANDGSNTALISKCKNTGSIISSVSIEGSKATDTNIGGITGLFKTGSVNGCVNTGNITGTGSNQTGGIIGSMYAAATNPAVTSCINTGTVKIENAKKTDAATYNTPAAGGITGSIFSTGNNTKMQNCRNAGLVTFTGSDACAGAMIGSGTKLTSNQLNNINGNIAQSGSSEKLAGVVSTTAEGILTDNHFRFADDMTDIFTAADLATEYENALSEIVSFVEETIDAIGEVTAESKEAIAAARSAYDRLPAGMKDRISNYETLTEAEKTYEDIVGPEPPVKTNIKIKTIKLSASKFIYTGKYIKPTVKISGLVKGTDYTVAYSNNKAIGKATVKITGTGDYEGSVSKYFTINPKKVTGLKLTAGRKKMTVKFNKSAGGVKYKIAYRKKGTSKWTIKNTTSTKVVIKKLKSKKVYQTRVRAFKAVKGGTYSGAWSGIKTVRIK
ncbi:MAG: hypothetical protein Q4A48_05180 [Bacillota bacterium]|nr:hypothetical protein [Bacillota bacterium]